MPVTPADLIVIGRFSGTFGVKGWLKVYSYTDPFDNFLEYRYCQIQRNGVWHVTQMVDVKVHGKGLIAKLQGVETPEQAAEYVGCDVAVVITQLPVLQEDEFYWHQLEGLRVSVNHPERGQLVLGRVDHILETGANDVLVVKGDESSIDRRERLIPYLPERVVLKIDLVEQTMLVDWDPDF